MYGGTPWLGCVCVMGGMPTCLWQAGPQAGLVAKAARAAFPNPVPFRAVPLTLHTCVQPAAHRPSAAGAGGCACPYYRAVCVSLPNDGLGGELYRVRGSCSLVPRGQGRCLLCCACVPRGCAGAAERRAQGGRAGPAGACVGPVTHERNRPAVLVHGAVHACASGSRRAAAASAAAVGLDTDLPGLAWPGLSNCAFLARATITKRKAHRRLALQDGCRNLPPACLPH